MEKDYKKQYARQIRYHERNYIKRYISLTLRKDDKDTKAMLEKLDTVPSKNAYIIDLIRKDIGEENK